MRGIARFVRNMFRDIRYGGLLGGVKKTPFAALGAHDTANSDYQALEYLFERSDSLVIGESAVLVDVGCGKGRVLNYWLSRFPRNKMYGIELDPAIANRTRKRLRPYENVTILCGDVRQLFPRDATLAYLFNPFGRVVLTEFLSKLRHERQGLDNSPIDIIYYNPVYLEVFSSDSACHVTEINLPPHLHRAFLIRISPRSV